MVAVKVDLTCPITLNMDLAQDSVVGSTEPSENLEDDRLYSI